MFLFSYLSPLSTSSNNIFTVSTEKHNSKKSTKSSTKHVNSKKFQPDINQDQYSLFHIHVKSESASFREDHK